MQKYFLSPLATNDIEEIVTYIASENKRTAQELLDSFFETMDNLSLNPNIGHKREDLTTRPVLFWPFKWHYLIIYKTCSPIEIVRVLSGYRDIVNLL